jgi:predicted nucleic acid-binding Zn ribbon protein
MPTCVHCGKDFSPPAPVCPHCQKSLVPDYPSMGSKVFMVIWIFFVALVMVMLITILAR